jgi:hypothetical protein
MEDHKVEPRPRFKALNVTSYGHSLCLGAGCAMSMECGFRVFWTQWLPWKRVERFVL